MKNTNIKSKSIMDDNDTMKNTNIKSKSIMDNNDTMYYG